MDDDDAKMEALLDETSNPSASNDQHLDEASGQGEQQTETDNKSEEGAVEPITKQTASSASGASSSADREANASSVLIEDIEEAIQYAKKYLEDLLSFFGLNTEIHATTEDKEVIELDIPSTHLNGFLIGHNGDTMRALQYTVSNALKSQNYAHTRVNVDVAEYKKQRAGRLVDTAEAWFKEVKTSGQPKELQPMNPADRRVVHQAATDYGLLTESVGFGRDRHIVLKPADSPSEEPTDA